jgi:hypothetical protein
MATRQRLPNRRLAETFELEVNGLRYTVTTGRHPDGRILEVHGRPSTPLGAAIDIIAGGAT